MSPEPLNAGSADAVARGAPCRTGGGRPADTMRPPERHANDARAHAAAAARSRAGTAPAGCRRSTGTRSDCRACRRTASPSTMRERRRLARLDRDAVKDHLAARGDRVDDEIALADRAAAGKDDEVGVARTASSAAISASIVSCAGAVRLGDAAVRRDDRAERKAVDVVDLAGRERPARLDDFVAGREDRDARPRVHLDVGAADRGQRADAARRQHIACAHDPSPAAMSAPRRPMFCPGDRGAKDRRPRRCRLARLLDHDDGVGALRHRRAGRDFGARAGGDRRRTASGRCRCARRCAARGRRPRGAGGVGGDDRVAVHRGARERRHVDRRRDVRGGDAAGRCARASTRSVRAIGRTRRVEAPARFVERDAST